ncbi:hypothetical protein ROA7450_02961 [Roseovarius albus]|uniref:Uncharacterized protein n=1 Tax=Roseovarius albus TaxID=1247867 RepID=A0A1X6ZNS5_9RHOB|nr:hypothetical protein ROA7450_02961 [Roseovarius albus]
MIDSLRLFRVRHFVYSAGGIALIIIDDFPGFGVGDQAP